MITVLRMTAMKLRILGFKKPSRPTIQGFVLKILHMFLFPCIVSCGGFPLNYETPTSNMLVSLDIIYSVMYYE